MNAEEIARKRSLKVSTIYEHLAKLLEAGYEIDINQLVSKNKQEYIRLAIKKALLNQAEIPVITVMDVTETPRERPQKKQKDFFGGKRGYHT